MPAAFAATIWLTAASFGSPSSSARHSSPTQEGGDCPERMIYVEGGAYALGEWDAAWLRRYCPNGVIEQFSLSVDAFCMDRFPFPGLPATPWPRDGLSHSGAQTLDRELQAFGRRACTISELLLAGAGPSNHRFPNQSDAWPRGTCDLGRGTPKQTGTRPDCTSELGFHDFGVRSTWGRLDKALAGHLASYRSERGFLGKAYGVWGGAAASDTYYAPTNFGVHFHDPQESGYRDDTFRICADADGGATDQDPAFQAWLGEYLEIGQFEGFLDGRDADGGSGER